MLLTADVGARREETDESGAAQAEMRRLIMGFRTTQVIYAAAKLAIADHLAEGPLDPGVLAHAVGAHPGALSRLLRGLASLGIFAETTDGRYMLTPTARLLRTDVQGSLRGMALLYGDQWLWQAYGQTTYSVTTGRSAFERAHGQTLFDFLQEQPEAAATFDWAMAAFTEQESRAIIARYAFPENAVVVDVGGGQGGLLAAILAAQPNATGVLFDQPGVLRGQSALARSNGALAGRWTILPGDFFVTVPQGGDVYLLKSVLHDWSDPYAIAILRSCRQAMRASARLLIIERIVPEQTGPSEAKLFDINMLVVTGGLERTEREYRALVETAGLEVTQVIPTSAGVSILELRVASRSQA